MSEEQAINLVLERVAELVQDKEVQTLLLNKKAQGATDEDLRDEVTRIAIATLYGQ